MLKNISKLEFVIEGKVFQFLCDMDSALPMVKEALFQFGKYIGQIEDHVKAQQAVDQQNVPKPDIVPVENVPSEPSIQKVE
jgi:hypothetical protein